MPVGKRCLIGAGILLMPLVLLYCSQAIMLKSMCTPLVWIAAHPAAVGMTWLLISLPALTLYGLSRRLFIGYTPPGVIILALTLVSFYKNEINGAPLQLSDFSLAGELAHIAGYAMPQLEVSAVTVGAAGVAAAAAAGLWFIDRRARMRRRWAALLAMVCALFTVMAAAPVGVIQSAAVNLSRDCPEQRDRNNILAVPAGMYASYALRYSYTDEFDGDIWEILGGGDTAEYAQPRVTPDIIFLMSESFFDVARLPGVEFSRDPIPRFHAMQDSGVHGRFISNTFGGGTGYVEMEVFTGITSCLLREGDTLSSLSGEGVYESIPSVVRLLKNAGYSTTAVHSHNNKLYNRAEIYPQIGFDRVLFSDSFPEDAEVRGGYISDAALTEYIISLYNERDEESPCFIYAMSMENHQPYNGEKFGFGSGVDIASETLGEDGKAVLDVLLTGLGDADSCLGMLADYFSQVDRPVMLVFAGDHMPTLTLPGADTVYSRLGMCGSSDTSSWEGEELKNMLSTDYVIWTNYDEAGAEELTQSCTFMGLELLKRAGVEPDAYFGWLGGTVRPQMLMYRARLFVDGGGGCYAAPPDDVRQCTDAYRIVVRNILYN